MQIVVNHLTRMKKGYICVAGVDLQTSKHARPVAGRLSTQLLACHGGLFDMGVVVDLGSATPCPNTPEVEDHTVDLAALKAGKAFDPTKFWKLLKQLAQPKLSTIFGPDLQMRGATSCGVDEHKGSASLGCLLPAEKPDLYVRPAGDRPAQVRMRVSDGAINVDLGVTDIRLYGDDHVTADENAVKRIAKAIQSDEVILSVGLTRAMPSSGGFPPIHWLQVNNIHLAKNPLWQLG